MKRWYVRWHPNFYAYGPVTAHNKKEVRAIMREILEVGRLPAGFEMWRASP